MKKFEVTFRDEIEAETIEQAYAQIIQMCAEVAENEDVTAFQFIKLPPVHASWCDLNKFGGSLEYPNQCTCGALEEQNEKETKVRRQIR